MIAERWETHEGSPELVYQLNRVPGMTQGGEPCAEAGRLSRGDRGETNATKFARQGTREQKATWREPNSGDL